MEKMRVLLVDDHPEDTHLVKESEDGSKGAGCPAEWPLTEYHPDKEKNKEAHFPCKQRAEQAANVLVQAGQRYACF